MSLVDVVVEIPKGSNIKYEVETDSKQRKYLKVDRIVQTVYPFNYGYIEDTLSEDGDCLDAIMLTDHTFVPLSVVPHCRIVGMVDMIDEEGRDPKLLVVPIADKSQQDTKELDDIDQQELQSICNFFSVYKKNDPDRWCTIKQVCNAEEAMEELRKCMGRWEEQQQQQ